METWLRIGLEHLTNKIMTTPSNDLEGFRVKARVAAWWDEGSIDPENSEDKILAWIVRELAGIVEPT